MSYTIRHGLIVTTGGPRHKALVSTIVKHLIIDQNASPLDVFTEAKHDKFRFDVEWNGSLFEAETKVRHSMNVEKLKFLRENGKRVVFCLPVDTKFTNAAYYASWKRWADVIQEVWVFDTEKCELVKKFTVEKEAS